MSKPTKAPAPFTPPAPDAPAIFQEPATTEPVVAAPKAPKAAKVDGDTYINISGGKLNINGVVFENEAEVVLNHTHADNADLMERIGHAVKLGMIKKA